MNDSAWLPEIDRLACTGCGDCVVVCQPQALTLASAKAVVVRPEACTYCGDCEAVCPVGAIALPYLVIFAETEQARHLTG
jgi:ferredoxin